MSIHPINEHNIHCKIWTNFTLFLEGNKEIGKWNGNFENILKKNEEIGKWGTHFILFFKGNKEMGKWGINFTLLRKYGNEELTSQYF